MKTIQLKAMKPSDRGAENYVEAVTRDEANIFAVYKGEPGAFMWQADFADPNVAYQHASKWQAESKGQYRLDTTQFDAVMNSKPEPAGHPHAELMAQYAEDAKTSTAPWLNWESRSGPSWSPLAGHPLWDIMTVYRRKRLPEICGTCGQEVK